MKLFQYLFAILFVFLSCSTNVHAEDFSLGDFSQSTFSDKLPEKLSLLVGDKKYDLSREEILSWLEEKAYLGYNPIYQSEIEFSNICIYKKSLVCRLSFSYTSEEHIQKIYSLSLDDSKISGFVKDTARKINKDPENAKLKIENGKVSTFSLSSPGIKLNEEKSTEIITAYLIQKEYTEPIRLDFEKIKPEISTDSIDNLGITELIGEGRSNFKGSPKNRIYNIKVATNRFNGTLIKPKEEFSFVKVLGEVDGEHGYLPELVIKKDKTEPEFGGGICQVSTTAFRAAINTGLEITARRNHVYPVSYYNPQGMDATVYVPRPDLRFINDTPNYILIETKIDGTELIFNFYGTNDGRKINIIGPKILEKNPDGSMKATFTQQILGKNDELIREDVFNSSYDSPAKYPHPVLEGEILTKKPKDWSDGEWKDYKKAHGI